MAGLIALIMFCSPLSILAQAQYFGGIGRGTVQSVCFRPLDCLNDTAGTALPGTVCNDGDICTVNDLYGANCVCAGTGLDTDGDGVCNGEDDCPSVFGQQGSNCVDGDACTINDVLNAQCQCVGTSQDTDGDGVCDGEDDCPSVVGQQGSSCTDSTDCTVDDVLNVNCQCHGTIIVSVAATINGNWLLADGIAYIYTTSPVSGAEYDWSIQPNPGDWVLVEQGTTASVIAPPINAQASLCVSVTVGSVCVQYACTELFIMDVGLQEPRAADLGFSVRPNPSEGSFEMVLNRPLSGPVRYEVEDVLARSVLVSGTTMTKRTCIDLGSAARGVYLLRVMHDQGYDVIRLVVR